MAYWKYFFTLILFAVLNGCSQNEQHQLGFTGSSTVAPVITDLAETFESSRQGWRIDVQSGGSSRGIRDARQELADAGMISRSLAADEKDLAAHTFAHDGIALIVHADNPVKELTNSEIRRIYRGEIKNWPLNDNSDRPIMVINKADGRATLEVFLDYFELDNQNIKASLVAGENQQVIQTVARNTDAIGYVSIGAAEHEQKNGTAIKLLPLAGVAATTANVQSGDYPMSRPLNVVTRGAPGPELKTFMEFWKTREAAEIIRQHYFVPATP